MGMDISAKCNSNGLNNRKLMIEESLNKPYSECIMDALGQLDYNFVLTDPCILDHPIVYVSHGFLKMSGYSREEVIGRNARFLQGPATDRRAVVEIREAIRQEKPCQVCMLNYRKDGMAFWNLFNLTPVFSKRDGKVIHFIGVQVPISKFFKIATSCSVSEGCSSCANNRNNQSPGGASNGVIYFSSCRRELLGSFSLDLGTNGLYHTVTEQENTVGLEQISPPEAPECQKQTATAALASVLSELAQFSKFTGCVVSDNRYSCTIVKVDSINSSLCIALNRIQQSFVLTDPHSPGMPIVHASNMFLQLTGYSRHEVIGRNCRFLQGPETDRSLITQIRKSIEAEQSCTVQILNHRKDGSQFCNLLHTAPIRSSSGKIVFFAGVQVDVTENKEADNNTDKGICPHIKQLGAIGAIRVAVRSLLGLGSSR